MSSKTTFLLLFILSSSLPAAAEEDFPCADVLRASLGAEAFGKDLDLVRSVALLSASPDFPNPEALTKWKEVRGYVTDRTDLEAYPKLRVDCEDQHLYPTHPQQLLKLYHRFNSNQYDNQKLKAGDEPCLIGQKESQRNGPSSRPLACFRADIGYDSIISDTFEDACGHYYRGFKAVSYLGRDENMGTLFSAGRTTLQKPGSKIDNELVPGHTYAVPVKDLLFVGPLFPGDEAEIKKLREAAKAGSEYDPATRTYRMKP
jgi:hypothetical protein